MESSNSVARVAMRPLCRGAMCAPGTWLLLLTVMAMSPSARAELNWNQFRGPTGDGHAVVDSVPLQMSEKRNVRWKIPLPGKAWSSPVVWRHQIWLTNAPPDGKRMYAVCLDLDSGKQLLNRQVFQPAEPQFCHPLNSYATPTPYVEDGRVYVHFGAHGTACLDTRTGKTLWTRVDLPCDHFRGPASSPIVFEDLLIVPFDGFDLQYVVALNKRDGKTVWKHTRQFDYGTTNGDLKKAYCTPTVIEHAGRQQLICPAAVATEALDPRTGELLWTVRHGGMNASARPIYHKGILLITNGMGGMVAVRPDGQGDITANGVLWESSKGIPKKSSLLIVDDLLYMVSDNGVASCVQPETGRNVWSQRLGGDYAASPLYACGRIYFFSQSGEIPVIRPGRRFELLAENHLAAGFMASAAVADNSLILRTETHLYRIGE